MKDVEKTRRKKEKKKKNRCASWKSCRPLSMVETEGRKEGRKEVSFVFYSSFEMSQNPVSLFTAKSKPPKMTPTPRKKTMSGSGEGAAVTPKLRRNSPTEMLGGPLLACSALLTRATRRSFTGVGIPCCHYVVVSCVSFACWSWRPGREKITFFPRSTISPFSSSTSVFLLCFRSCD